MPLEVVQKLLRHIDQKITSQVYGVTMIDADVDAVGIPHVVGASKWEDAALKRTAGVTIAPVRVPVAGPTPRLRLAVPNATGRTHSRP